MSCFEHKECSASHTRNVLLRTLGMSCFEHKECPAWSTRNVLRETHGMSRVEHKECPYWNTGSVMIIQVEKFSAVRVCATFQTMCQNEHCHMQAFCMIGMIGMIIPMARCFHPNGQSHWDDSIPRDGGWLPHWDEALDESHWLCFSPLGEGGKPPRVRKTKPM